MLTQERAKSIAARMWGSADHEYACNRKGAFWFACSGHGGMVLDAECLTAQERKKISAHAEPDGGVYVFEEDCAWSIPAHLLGIARVNDEKRPGFPDEAARVFDRYFKPETPRRQAELLEFQARANKDPDLILVAFQNGDKVRVGTADGKAWIVEGYEEGRDEWGTPWLKLCRNPVEIDPKTHEPVDESPSP